MSRDGEIRVVMRPGAEKELLRSQGVGHLLRDKAKQVERRVRPPSGYTTSTRAGVGPRGAFSQVIMAGPRAIFVEFGTRLQAAKAPLRNALRGIR